ncbi:hypothetical protein BDV96DRAFT_655598 [Lophiotrema nucula]|uniref:Clr5 domain-containing protein n=1 Tax=Lophiotrema nucula TaxID=690887 RepID=A0A6A5YDU1_9PLEO|nr:hypothetical protein BDV96DRAFT_655598 [Lophiotrema nucula]
MPTPIPHDPIEFGEHQDMPGLGQPAQASLHGIAAHGFNAEGGFQDHPIQSIEAAHDAVMVDLEPPPMSGPAFQRPGAIGGGSRRPRHGDLDWDGNRQLLHRLYIQEGHTLTETMKIMKEQHDFDASAKLYKEKFKFWRWQKNLPGEVAHWMVDRATLREAGGKQTEFEFGGQKWSIEQAVSTASRTKKAVQALVQTPAGMIVATPINPNNVASPAGAGPLNNAGSPGASSVIFISANTGSAKKLLHLNFKGKSREDLAAALLAARDYAQNEDPIAAESAYIEALDGHEHLLSSTNEATVKIAYELADFYTRQDCRAEADEILENITQKHISAHGINDRKTKQHLLQVAELLNSWNRGTDALAFLNHAWEVADAQQRTEDVSKTIEAGTRKRRKNAQKANAEASDSERLGKISQDITGNPTTARINFGLDVARLHIAVNDSAVEALLKATETQCLRNPRVLAVQGLKARADLLKHYLKQETATDHHDTFWTADDLLTTFWESTTWDRETFKSHEVMEASLELGAGVLRASLFTKAKWIFREIDRKASDVFGSDDERTIWIFISIGLIYQRYRMWSEARPWFEQAYAAADSAWGDSDGVTRALEKSLEKRHFSYLNDETRPFQSVFGVTGITIRPTRLHLE